MANPAANIALLVFSRTAPEEAQFKTFDHQLSQKANHLLAKDLIRNTYQVARQSQLPLHWISSEQQQGSNFAERFTQAFEQVFALGYEKVIAIGNDCPELNAATLIKAQRCFLQNEAVIGPAQDGGAYLVGISREIFQAQAFEKLRWNSAHLLEDLQEYILKQTTQLSLLDTKADIDLAEDFLKVIKRLPRHHALRKMYQSLVASRLSPVANVSNLLVPAFRVKRLVPRAPPLFLFV